ncbi:MAG: hypothetical protein ABSE73_18070, partial [Planctomycetota bacterium]
MAQSGSGRPVRQADEPAPSEGAPMKPAAPATSGRRAAPAQAARAPEKPDQAGERPARAAARPAPARRDPAPPAAPAGRPAAPQARTRPRPTGGAAASAAPAGGSALSGRNLYILAGGGVLAALVVVALIFHGKNKPSDSQSTAAPADKKTVAVPQAVEKAPPPPDVEPDDPQSKKPWLLNQYEKYVSANPEAFSEQLQRLMDAEKKFEKDDNWLNAIDKRLKALRQRREKKAEGLVEATGTAARKKAESGDYKGALAELDKFPDELSSTDAGMRVYRFRKEMSDKAMAQFNEADKRAEQSSQAGDYAAALKAYEPLASFGHPQIDKLVTARSAEIKDIQTRGKNPSEGKNVELTDQRQFFRADVYFALPGMVEAYDEAYHEGVMGPPESAKEKMDLAKYPRSAVLYYAKAMLLAREGAAEEARWCGKQAERVALPDNKAFRSRLLCLDSHLALFTGGDLQTSGDKAREALDLDGKNADAVFLLGIVHYYMAHFANYGSPKE